MDNREKRIQQATHALIANEQNLWPDELTAGLHELRNALYNDNYGLLNIFAPGTDGYLEATQEQVLAQKTNYPQIPVANGESGEVMYFIPPLPHMCSIADTASITHTDTPNLWVMVVKDAADQPMSTSLFTFPTALVSLIDAQIENRSTVFTEGDVVNTILERLFGISTS